MFAANGIKMSSSIFPITQEIPCVLTTEVVDGESQIQALSRRTGISLLNEASEGFCLSLSTQNRLELYNLKAPRQRVVIDFTSGEFLHRIKTSGKQQPLAKSIGVAKGINDVLDVTGGLGGDAMILASVGCRVTICERHPAVALLLEDGLKRAHGTHVFSKNIELKMINALEYLKGLKEKPQAIYMDPMYPIKEKSALPRKEMKILEDLVGADEDQRELFELALISATERVVVKRPRSAPALAPPTHSFEGTTTRYDMYILKSDLIAKNKL